MTAGEKPSVMVLGLRGVLGVQGGIETHARMLYPLLSRLGCDVEIIQRLPYFRRDRRKHSWKGMRLRYFWAPKVTAIETAFHSFIGVLYAAVKRPDILHLHGIGPGLLAPLGRFLGLKVVVTHHTFDYRREKWGYFARAVLAMGERLSMTYANGVIAVSQDIQMHITKTYKREAAFIPNGARVQVKATTAKALHLFNLSAYKYVLSVGRFETTKRIHDLIDAFERANTADWKLVLVGGLDAGDDYTRRILDKASVNDDIVFTDYQTGRSLQELYSWAGLFVICSSHEGQPIALLEALGHGVPVLASSIPAMRSVRLPDSRFFETGDVNTLAELIEQDIHSPCEPDVWVRMRDIVRRDYDWKLSARSTLALYQKIVGPASKGGPRRP